MWILLEFSWILCAVCAVIVLFAKGRFWTMIYGITFDDIQFPYIFSKKKQLAIDLGNVYKQYSEELIVGVRLFFVKPAFVIRDLKIVKMILFKNFDHFQNRGLFHNEKDDSLSAILGTVDHEQWKPLRKSLAPAFISTKMKDMFPKIKNMCEQLVENLNGIIGEDEDKTIEILETFSRFTTDAIIDVAFGDDCKESAARVKEMIKKAKQPYLTYPFNRLVVAFPSFARYIGMRKHRKEVTDFFENYVADIVNYRIKNNVRHADFMQSMIDAKLGVPRIAAVSFDLLSAGYADSTSTLSYILYELSLNENIQSKARDEVHDLKDEEFTYDTLKKMSYCRQIIQEIERKYPVAGIATRVANKTFKVPGTDLTIPNGMKVFIPVYAIHHDEKYYPEPEVFNPDRFAKDSRLKPVANSFLPFGDGPRKCLGSKFAEMLIGIGLVTLLNSFEFSTCPETQIPIEFNEHKNTMHPKGGVTLTIRRI